MHSLYYFFNTNIFLINYLSQVEYALDFPWYSSLPRVETRLYLEQYGGGGDVWIGKTLYRYNVILSIFLFLKQSLNLFQIN